MKSPIAIPVAVQHFAECYPQTHSPPPGLTNIPPLPFAGEGWGEGERPHPTSCIIAQRHPHLLQPAPRHWTILCLERFKVPAQDQVRVPHESLRRTLSAIFEKMGEPPHNVAAAVETLVTADLWGVESHGVSNMVKIYVERYGDGRIKADPQWRVLRETPATAMVDADEGLAIIIGRSAMNLAVEKAKRRRSRLRIPHQRRTLRRARRPRYDRRPSGHARTRHDHRRFAHGPHLRRRGNARHEPHSLRSSRPKRGTLRLRCRHDRRRPEQDQARPAHGRETPARDGSLTTTARRTMDEIDPPDTDNPLMLPFAGTRELGSHKSYGIAMMVMIMSTLMAGQRPTMLTGELGGEHVFAAFNIEAFTDLDEFKDNMDGTLKALREAEPAPGHDRVFYAGLSEYEDTSKTAAPTASPSTAKS